MAERFDDGTHCIIPVKTPLGDGWREVRMANPHNLGFPCRAFIHVNSNLAVMSGVEVMDDEDKGPEYHISISKQIPNVAPRRCDSNEAKWVLAQFGMDGAEEDNHVPHGVVRNFWRPVAENLIGQECPCKTEEPAIREDKGDFVWRPVGK